MYGQTHRWATLALFLVVFSGVPPASAAPISYDLTFETTGQSIWNTGSSFMLDETRFLGAAWTNKTVSIDAIAGNDDTAIFNPARIAYDAAYGACTLLHSASACINGQTAQVPVPALGSRPGVRSCGAFNFACQAARLGDLSRRAAYDVAFGACTLTFSASVCRNGQPVKLPVVALGTAPSPYLSVDTRTGFALNGTTDGRVGLEVGFKVDSGSVNATLAYQATLDVPNTAGLDKSNAIQLNPNSIFAGTNGFNTTFPSLALSVDAVLEVSGSVTAEGCFITQGCITGGTPFNIAETAPIVSFNADGEGGILLLGVSPSFFGLPAEANGFPFELDVAGLATVTLHLPQPNANGSLDPATKTLKGSEQDDLIDLIIDVDNVVATAAGVPGLFGMSTNIPLLGSIGFDIINVGMGPTIDLKQEFEIDPTLFVTLAFDKAVMIGGQIVTTYTSPWDLLPAITFLDDVTTVTPTFFVQAEMQNRTLLDFDLGFLIDLLQITYDFDLLGEGTLGIGNVLDKGVDLFESPDLYSNLFPLQGFNLQIGDPFVVNFLTGSTGPESSVARFAVNDIVLPGDVSLPIPAPNSLWLLLIGLLSAGWLRHSARPSRYRPAA